MTRFALAAGLCLFAAASWADAPGKAPATIVLHRQAEPRQQAFTVLVPDGWLIEGGLFSVDPQKAGGSLNSVETKCDFTVKRDAAGTVMARWAPTWNFVDFSRSPQLANLAQMFPPGRVYNGALVKPMPTVEAYLAEGFASFRPRATDVRIVERIELPELVEILNALARDTNMKLQQLGQPPMTFTAGALVWDYTEAGVRYREAAATALCDWRGVTGIWSNQFTFHMRAPAAEADAWKPLLDIVRQSLRINPQWLAAYQRATQERSQTAADVMRALAHVDQEIFDRRSKQRSAIQHENYLLLSGQEDYVNPFTKEVERDTSDYAKRWTTSAGDYIYSNADNYDPNRDPAVNRTEWEGNPRAAAVDPESHMRRTAEPEIMDERRGAKAYAASDFSDVNQRFVDRLVELAGAMKTARAVDLGTGPGDIPLRLLKARPGWRLVGVDASKPMLAFARRAAKKARAGRRVRWVCRDAKRTKLPAHAFDVVLSNSILHHVPDAVALWREVKRLAKPGALVLFRDLSRPRSAAAARRIVARYGGCGPELMQRDYYNSLLAAWTPAEVRRQLARAGLGRLRVRKVTDRHWDAWGFVG